MKGTRWAIRPEIMDIAREPIKFGHHHRTALPAGKCKCFGEARAPVQHVGTFAAFDLDEILDD
jgi:hypothetical protein